jgi:hypothetical protein
MSIDDGAVPRSRGDRFKAALGSINAASVSRFCKYVVLLLGLGVTVHVVFDAYSYYVARRDIDAELRSKRVSSIEYLNVLSQRERALALTTLEGRCSERLQLTMFRIFDAEQEPIQAVYRELVELKNKMKMAVQKLGPDLVDVEKAIKFIDGIEFEVSGIEGHRIEEYLVPINDAAKGDPNFKKLTDEIAIHREKYAAVATANAALKQRVEETRRRFGEEGRGVIAILRDGAKQAAII